MTGMLVNAWHALWHAQVVSPSGSALAIDRNADLASTHAAT